MKTKTASLTGAALDWMVAMCEKTQITGIQEHLDESKEFPKHTVKAVGAAYRPSSSWRIAGPIIEREKISPYYMPGEVGGAWRAERLGWYPSAGPTLPVAAMRCYVASKLGDEVDVPEELL